jgi:transposase
VDDRGLYQAILGLSAPWQVEQVTLRMDPGEVDVWIAAKAATPFGCPECAAPSPIHDHAERRWRHFDTCQFGTLHRERVPRVRFATHGDRTARAPWDEPGSPFTLLFERLAKVWLREAAPTAVARRLGLSWDEACGIMPRLVQRGLARRKPTMVPHLGIDEKSSLKRYQCVSVVVDLDTPRIPHVADDRKAVSLSPFFCSSSEGQRLGITAIAMDMWETYRKTLRAYVPGVDQKIVFDKFQIIAQRALADPEGPGPVAAREATGANHLVHHHDLLLTQYGHTRLRYPRVHRRVQSRAARGEARCVALGDR